MFVCQLKILLSDRYVSLCFPSKVKMILYNHNNSLKDVNLCGVKNVIRINNSVEELVEVKTI